MSDLHKPEPRDAARTKARILEAAQVVFSERGYSQAGFREIAQHAQVASSLIVKYYGGKARLFDEALQAAFAEYPMSDTIKPGFGRLLVDSVQDPTRKIVAPAMVALSLGDDEAREIAARVARDHIVGVVAEWLGPPEKRARAVDIMMLSMGFAIFSRYLQVEPSPEVREASAAWVAETLQRLVEQG